MIYEQFLMLFEANASVRQFQKSGSARNNRTHTSVDSANKDSEGESYVINKGQANYHGRQVAKNIARAKKVRSKDSAELMHDSSRYYSREAGKYAGKAQEDQDKFNDHKKVNEKNRRAYYNKAFPGLTASQKKKLAIGLAAGAGLTAAGIGAYKYYKKKKQQKKEKLDKQKASKKEEAKK